MSRVLLYLIVILLISPGVLSAQETGKPEWISIIDWSPNGTSVAASYRNNQIWLLTDTLEPIVQFPLDPEQVVSQLLWSPDSNRLAASTSGCARDDRIYIWDANTQELLLMIQQNQTVSARISWSPDGRQLAATESEHINIWNVDTGNLVDSLPGHEFPGSAIDIAWHPDGVQLASGGGDYVVRVWNALTNEMIAVLSLPKQDWVYNVTWSPDGNMLAASAREDVYVWSTSDFQQATVLTGTGDLIMNMSWKGTILAASSSDSTIRIWETSTWQLLQTFPLKQHVSKAFSLSPDGNLIAHSNLEGALEISPVQ